VQRQNYVKTKTRLKIKEEGERTQDFIMVHSFSRVTSSCPCQQAKNSTKHKKYTLNIFKNLSCTIQNYTKLCATPYCTSTDV